MPVSWTTILRLVVMLAMAAHVFYIYSWARAYDDVVGWDGMAVLALCTFSAAMLLPLAWAAALPDLPEIIRRHVGRKRWEQGRCPRCAYPLVAARGDDCPECGAERRAPASYLFGWATIRRFVLLALVAWVIGCAGAEYWARADEQAFLREALAHVAATEAADGPATPWAISSYTRSRRWPASELLHYTREHGVSDLPPTPAVLWPSDSTAGDVP